MTRSKPLTRRGQPGTATVRHHVARSSAGAGPSRRAVARGLPWLVLLSLGGCATAGAPSFTLFGAFFPAWMLCAGFGIAAAIAARGIFLATGLAELLAYQLFVCSAIGVIAAVLPWLLIFER